MNHSVPARFLSPSMTSFKFRTKLTVWGCSLLCSVTGNRYVPSGASCAIAAGAGDCWRAPELFRKGTWMVTEIQNIKHIALLATHQLIFYCILIKEKCLNCIKTKRNTTNINIERTSKWGHEHISMARTNMFHSSFTYHAIAVAENAGDTSRRIRQSTNQNLPWLTCLRNIRKM